MLHDQLNTEATRINEIDLLIMRLIVLVPLISSVNAIEVSRLARTIFVLPIV